MNLEKWMRAAFLGQCLLLSVFLATRYLYCARQSASA